MEVYYFPNTEFQIDEYWGREAPACIDRKTAEADLKWWNESSYDLWREDDETEEPFCPVTFWQMFHEATEEEIEEYGIA